MIWNCCGNEHDHVQVKAEKILAKAREEANRINSKAQEETEKAIANAYTRAERVSPSKKNP